jgi:hypothetical protein
MEGPVVMARARIRFPDGTVRDVEHGGGGAWYIQSTVASPEVLGMTDIEAIRIDHQRIVTSTGVEVCTGGGVWPCDASVALAALDEARADLEVGQAIETLRRCLPEGWGFSLNVTQGDDPAPYSVTVWNERVEDIDPMPPWYASVADAIRDTIIRGFRGDDR